MHVVAGVDIGNSTTEVVLVDRTGPTPSVIGVGRAFTTGPKGSAASLAGASALIRRLHLRHHVESTQIRVSRLASVDVDLHSESAHEEPTWPLIVHARGNATAAGDGAAVGAPVPVELLTTTVGATNRASGSSVIALVSRDIPYAEAARLVNESRQGRQKVVGVVVERDEAVLVANRLTQAVPVLDQVAMDEVRNCDLMAIEARPAGRPLTQVSDPFWLADVFGLQPGGSLPAAAARRTADGSFALVARSSGPPPPQVAASGRTVEWVDGSSTPLGSVVPEVRAAAPGSINGVGTEDGRHDVDDLFVVSLGRVADLARSRQDTVRRDLLLSAELRRPDSSTDPAAMLEAELDTAVVMMDSEAAAGRWAALTTPGAPADAIVVDIGGGTIDLTDGTTRHVLAGAGDLLTRSTAAALGLSTALAEYVKRGPALLFEAPHVFIDEKMVKRFVDEPVRAGLIGRLATPSPTGHLAFNDTLSPAEWRAWRSAAKSHVIGENIRRGVSGLRPSTGVILIGGAAGDDELVPAVTEAFHSATGRAPSIGRGNIAGSLAHRYAVAYGLACDEEGAT